MQSDGSSTARKWYSNGRWALALAVVGILMIAIVAVTRGEHGAWTLWFAIPMLMISLGYFFVVNAVAFYWGKGAYHRDEPNGDKEPPSK